MKSGARLSSLFAILALAIGLVAGFGDMPTGGLLGVGDAHAQQAPMEQQALPRADMWRAVREGVQGTVSIPDQKAGILVQSAGEGWRNTINGPVKEWGGWLLLATVVVLALFFLLRGRIRIEHGPSGRTIERFNLVERFAHWLTAVSFILLALTGLNLTYGRPLFLDSGIMGKATFAEITMLGKLVHNYIAFAFMLGVLMMFVLWVSENLPNRHDAKWLAKGGGMFRRGVHPPARKFNAGQKLVFWGVFIGGVVVSVSGVYLLFPFAFTDVFGMQNAQLFHAIVALVLTALILAHIYIGTLGMEGAISAMWSGRVDRNWAEEHHPIWVQELDQDGGAPAPAAPRPATAPAGQTQPA